ncbi:MAG: type II secretion system F family protein, partial [bacterium]
QLMDALILLSNSLRSGLDIVQGFERVSKDLLSPISDEFSLVIRNYQLGTPFEKALENMEDRVASRLLSYMIKAIILQRQVGGNLTKIFERIVENIREESKLEEKTKSLTAQQKIQSIVVGIMPWIMVGVMFLFQGQTMAKFYFSGIGIFTFFMCALWIAIGMKFVQSLGNIRV